MPIQILPPILANQIAAGEVVERPASVVKELIENALDAGASRIDVEIDKGGHKRILVRDNGKGIVKDELALALSRHATSKIHHLDDLENIQSLGFRGEALASISSVSRLTLTSKPKNQENAWQAHAEGSDMQVQVQPAAHPQGTSIDVKDLFFNTPARRKFLRAEKTEFGHIDEVIRRIALSRFDTYFTLSHNGKTLRRYPAGKDHSARFRRVKNIAGRAFAEQALEISSQYTDIKLHGWISVSAVSGSQDVQYSYVNGRMMRDKLINHAIRQAQEEHFPNCEQSLSFILYVDMPAKQLDINVHPAKHEVRFHQARLVHDFIYRALSEALQQQNKLTPRDEENDTSHAKYQVMEPQAPQHSYIQPIEQQVHARASVPSSTSSPTTSVSRQAVQNYSALMSKPTQPTSLAPNWLLVENRYLLVNSPKLAIIDGYQLLELQLQQQINQSDLVGQPLLMPLSIPIDAELLELAKQRQEALKSLSIQFNLSQTRLMLKQVPSVLRDMDWTALLQKLISQQPSQPIWQQVTDSLSQCNGMLTSSAVHRLWAWLENHYGEQLTDILDLTSKPISLNTLLND